MTEIATDYDRSCRCHCARPSMRWHGCGTTAARSPFLATAYLAIPPGRGQKRQAMKDVIGPKEMGKQPRESQAKYVF